MNFRSGKDRKAVAADRRPICEAPTAEVAARQLDGEMGRDTLDRAGLAVSAESGRMRVRHCNRSILQEQSFEERAATALNRWSNRTQEFSALAMRRQIQDRHLFVGVAEPLQH